jgi:hypothetical protein
MPEEARRDSVNITEETYCPLTGDKPDDRPGRFWELLATVLLELEYGE